MLKTSILHPQILHALGRAGHSSKVLIADGNYPHHTKRGPNADIVYLNFAPGMMTVTDVLAGIANAVPIELAEVMEPLRTGAYAMKNDPPVFDDFRRLLKARNAALDLTKLERPAFYDYVPGGYSQIDIIGYDGYHHRGYYDRDNRWHGGFYDNNRRFHADADDWRHDRDHDRRRDRD